MNSPCAIIATCMNCCFESPTISSIFRSVSFGSYCDPSGMVRSTDPLTRRTDFPFFAPRVSVFRCAGTRRTVYLFSSPFPSSPSVKTSSTNGSTLSGTYWLCRMTPSFRFSSELASPYSAKTIASKIVVFPAPVSPVIRNRF